MIVYLRFPYQRITHTNSTSRTNCYEKWEQRHRQSERQEILSGFRGQVVGGVLHYYWSALEFFFAFLFPPKPAHYYSSTYNMVNQVDMTLRFLIVGESGVGKSCLMTQFADRRFHPVHDTTIGVEFSARMIVVDGKHIKLQIWDTAGQETFRSVARSYYRGANGCIIVYDLTNRDSFEVLDAFLQEAKANVPPDCVMFLVGNKADLEAYRQVTREEGEQYAAEHGLQFLETSAKSGHNVNDAFVRAGVAYYEKVQRGEISDAAAVFGRPGQSSLVNPRGARPSLVTQSTLATHIVTILTPFALW